MPVHDTAGAAGRTEPGGDQAREPEVTPWASRQRALRDALAGRVPPGWRMPLATYLACQIIFLFWWAAFYPGLKSYDSVTYLLHVTTGPWVANHSVLYDSMVWVSLHATGGLAALTLAQTVAMSAALAYTVAAFRRLGVPGRWTAVAAVVLAALPPTGTFFVFVWKDVPFSICAYLVVPTLAHLLSLRGRRPGWRGDRQVNRLIAALGLELLGTCLFRLDGFLIVVVTAIILVLLLPGLRARLAAVAAAAVSVSFVLSMFVYPAAGIQRPSSSLTLGPAYADIAVAYAEQPSSFTTADKRLMARVAPLASWKKSANCYDADWTTNIRGFSGRSAKVSGQLFSLWLRVLGRSPQLILGARICRGSIAWSIFPGPPRLDAKTLIAPLWLTASSWPRVTHNPYRPALLSRPLSRTAHTTAAFLWNFSRANQLDWLLWRGALWCYVCYLAAFAFAQARRRWALLSLAAIVAAQQLVVLADNPAQLFRYMVGPILIGIMMVPLFFARKRSAPTAEHDTNRVTRSAASAAPVVPS